jgi:hypothetical protein
LSSAFGVVPLVAAPMARGDIVDVIVDPVNPVSPAKPADPAKAQFSTRARAFRGETPQRGASVYCRDR